MVMGFAPLNPSYTSTALNPIVRTATAPYPGNAVSTRRTQYEAPSGITSSLKL
jgi:hypothetical protein